MDEPPKSAFEIAMERLRKKDADEGLQERPVTKDQRDAIAEARKVCEAKLAEREILYHSALRKTEDPEARAALELEYRRERERIQADRDRKLAEIRKGDGGTKA
jgi:hypothetical protein